MLSSNPARTTLVDTFFTDFPLPKDKGAIFSRHPSGTPTITILEPLLCNTLCERPKRQDQLEVNTTVLIRDTAMARHGGDQRERPKKKKNRTGQASSWSPADWPLNTTNSQQRFPESVLRVREREREEGALIRVWKPILLE
jgi:hypothetical protein